MRKYLVEVEVFNFKKCWNVASWNMAMHEFVWTEVFYCFVSFDSSLFCIYSRVWTLRLCLSYLPSSDYVLMQSEFLSSFTLHASLLLCGFVDARSTVLWALSIIKKSANWFFGVKWQTFQLISFCWRGFPSPPPASGFVFCCGGAWLGVLNCTVSLILFASLWTSHVWVSMNVMFMQMCSMWGIKSYSSGF